MDSDRFSNNRGQRKKGANRIKRSEVLKSFGRNEKDDNHPRRQFLGVIAGIAATLGFSGVARAIDVETAREKEFKKLASQGANRYSTDEDMKRAFDRYGEAVLNWSAENGFIPSPDASDLDYEDTSVSAVFYGDTPTNQLTFKTNVDAGRLRIVVQPEVHRQYAIIRPEKQNEDALIFDPDNTSSTESLCPWGFACIGCCCACEECEVYCCEGGCYTSNCDTDCCNCDYANCKYVCG